MKKYPFNFKQSHMSYSKLEERLPLNPAKACSSTNETGIISQQPSLSSFNISSLTSSVDNFISSDSDDDSVDSEPFASIEDEDELFLAFLFGKKDDSSILSYQSGMWFSSTKVNPPESEKDENEIEDNVSCCPSLNRMRFW